MLMLFWVGAGVSAYLGYKMHDWWVPALVACAAVAGQFVLLHLAGGGRGPTAQLVGFGVMDFVMFYATFGIGRTIGQRRRQRGKGAR